MIPDGPSIAGLVASMDRDDIGLTAFDEQLVHQTGRPIAASTTSDHRAFDRVVYMAHDPTGHWSVLWGLAAYRNTNSFEGYACVRNGHLQHNLRLTRPLLPQGVDLAVGPLRVEVLEPMAKLRAVLGTGNRWGYSFELNFDAVAPAVLESRHLHRYYGRTAEDFLRYHQVGTVSGTLETAEGTVAVDKWFGLRDHSWGVRPGVGGFEPRSSGTSTGWTSPFLLWVVFCTATWSGQLELREDSNGEQLRLVGYVYDRRNRSLVAIERVDHQIRYSPGTRRFCQMDLELTVETGRHFAMRAEPSGRAWVFRGTGYDGGFNDGRGLGVWRGETVEVDDYEMPDDERVRRTDGSDADDVRPRHRENPSVVVLDGEEGFGHIFCAPPKSATVPRPQQ